MDSEAELNAPFSKIFLEFYTENAEWTLVETSTAVDILQDEISRLQFILKLRRKPVFLVVNVVIPILFLSVLNTGVFLLSRESGERIAFCITMLLSFAVF